GGHLAAWAGGSPGNNESAEKRKRSDARKGNVYLMTALVEAAHGASRSKGMVVTSTTSFSVSRRDAGISAPRSPSPTSFPTLSTSCSRPALSTAISTIRTSTSSTNDASQLTSSAARLPGHDLATRPPPPIRG